MNRPRNTQSFHEIRALVLLGIGILMFLGLISYDPRDVPSYTPLIATASPPNTSTGNYVGLVGTILAGYGYFLFGAGSYLIAILLVTFGFGKLFRSSFPLKERLGWSLVLILSFCALMEIQPWFLLSWKNKFGIEGPGGWFGNALARAFSPLGTVGSTIILLLLYFASLILATGFHPIAFVRQAIAFIRSYLQQAREKHLAQLDELSQMEVQKKALEKKANKLEKKLNKKLSKTSSTDSVPVPLAEEGFLPKPKIIDTSIPQTPTQKPTLSSLKEKKPQSGLTHVQLDHYELPSLDLLTPPSTEGVKPADPEELRTIQEVIIQTLQQFSVEAKPGASGAC